ASCSANDGKIKFTFNFGTSPYAISVDSGSNFVNSSVSDTTFIGLNSGSYTNKLIIRDGNGCVVRPSLTVNIGINTIVNSSPSTTIAFCPGSTVTLSSISIGNAYVWNPSNATTSSINLVATTAASYIVNVTNGVCTYHDTIRLSPKFGPVITLNSVSYDSLVTNLYKVKVKWNFANANFFNGTTFTVNRRLKGATPWSLLTDTVKIIVPASGSVDSRNYSFVDMTAQKGDVYEYQILGNGTSSCGATAIQSVIHNTIHVTAKGSESGSTISANVKWNSYINWATGVAKYRIYRSVNPDYTLATGPVFELIDSTVFNTSTQIIDTTKTDQSIDISALSLLYRIEAVSFDGKVSWSDTAAVTFVRDIKVFNTFTPNNDNVDEFFHIQNIQAYPNEIYIFNRWGQRVFYSKDYKNDWDGSNLPDGTYYYTLNYSEGSKANSDGKYTKSVQGFIMLLR
ncbi:MAG: gliding motility-associated C-terminal domain-containing protein, partial [Cytophagales bacterium]|nr:gliding motility-associated C-terminal domain-containing protein [Cytophagales bacterium]